MYLYKIEIELNDQTVYLIVVSETDSKAFDYVEGHLARHFVSSPVPNQVSVVEKKRLDKGAGFIIETV